MRKLGAHRPNRRCHDSPPWGTRWSRRPASRLPSHSCLQLMYKTTPGLTKRRGSEERQTAWTRIGFSFVKTHPQPAENQIFGKGRQTGPSHLSANAKPAAGFGTVPVKLVVVPASQGLSLSRSR